MASTKKLVAFDLEAHEFCCAKHQQACTDIQAKATDFLSALAKEDEDTMTSFTPSSLQFARNIVMGRLHRGGSVSSDPDRIVTVPCVHRVQKTHVDDEGKESTIWAPCGTMIEGTPKQVGGWKTKCEEHRS